MKRFLVKLSCAVAALFLVYLCVLQLLMHNEKNSYLKAIRISTGNRAFVCNSDSMTVYSMNPEFWNELVNISGEGAPFDVQLMKLRDCIKENPGRIQTLLLDVSILSTACGATRPVVTQGTYAAKYYPLYQWHQQDNNELYGLVNKKFILSLDWLKFKLKELLKGNSKSTIAQGYLRRDGSSLSIQGRVSPDGGGISYAHSCNTGTGYQLDSWGIKCICQMIELCQANGIKVQIITLPLHHSITEHVTPATYERFYGLLAHIETKYKLPKHITFLQVPFEDAEFIDINHLNYAGGKKVVEALKLELSSH